MSRSALRSSGCGRGGRSRLCASRAFCAAFRWLCGKGIWWRFAAMSGFPSPGGSAMLSCCWPSALSAANFWGFIADRIGGLRTVLAGSACQVIAMIGFLLTQNEAGLFAVSAAFGLGFSGIIPAYVLALRELYRSAKRR